MLAVFLVSFFPISVYATSSWCAYPKRTHDGFVSIRTGPSTRYRRVMKVTPSDQLSVERCEGRWCFVDYARDVARPGWIHRNYIVQDPNNCGWYD